VTPRRILIVLLLAVGVGLMVWAFGNEGRQEDPAATGTGAQSDSGGDVAQEAVERFVPREGDLILRQDQVGVDLKPGYDADLVIEGIEIPLDQLTKIEAQNEVYYRPGPDKEVRALDAGDMCATARVRDLTRPDQPPRDVRWCFRVA
jgi:hypothetical protein